MREPHWSIVAVQHMDLALHTVRCAICFQDSACQKAKGAPMELLVQFNQPSINGGCIGPLGNGIFDAIGLTEDLGEQLLHIT